MGEKWEIITPGPPPPAYYDGRPGEDTIAAKRPASRKTPSKQEPKSQWSATKRIFGLIPWGALIAGSFLFTGLVIFLVQATKAASKSNHVLDLVNSNANGLYPHRVAVFTGSYAVTAGLSAGCLIASIFLAVVRLRQKLLLEKKERWGSCTFGVLQALGIFSFCAIILPIIWYTLNCMFLAAWGMGMYTLREALTPASITMQQVDMSQLSQQLTQPVDATNSICPSIGCFNLAYFVWLDSASCLCSQPLLSTLQDAARSALSSVAWTLGGAGCMWFGSLIAAAQGAADLALFRAEWKNSESSKTKSGSPSKKSSAHDDYSHTPGTALPKRNLYHVNGFNGFSGTGGGFYVRSPQPGMLY